jgi:TIR domain
VSGSVKSGRWAPFGHYGRCRGGALFWADAGFCEVSLQGFGEISGGACVKTQKNFNADDGLGGILLACYVSADMFGSRTVRSKSLAVMTNVLTAPSSQTYDVALSFAGEDRDYVDAVAVALKASNVRVFYDSFEKSNLWGKNLYDHLSDIYTKKSRFTVIFISKHYASKTWTNHERQAAQARAFKENSEYILPARFDDTPIPGLADTVGYISLKGLMPTEFAEIILNKLQTPAFAPASTPTDTHSKNSSSASSRSHLNTNSNGILLAVFISAIIILVTLNYLAAIEVYPPETAGEKLAIVFAGLLVNIPIVIGIWILYKFIRSGIIKLRGRR